MFTKSLNFFFEISIVDTAKIFGITLYGLGVVIDFTLYVGVLHFLSFFKNFCKKIRRFGKI